MRKKKDDNKIVIYTGKHGEVELRADVEKDTIWATQAQIADLFNVQPQAIIKHMQNIYRDGELQKSATCSKMEQVRFEGNRRVKRTLEFYNLDIIIAVGYRVNSKKATQFRIWATKTLRDYLLKGYVLNQKRLQESQQVKLKELEKTIQFITQVRNKKLSSDEASGLLSVIKEYTNTWILLQKYDEGELSIYKAKEKAKRSEEHTSELQSH